MSLTDADLVEKFNVPGVLRMLEQEAAAAYTGERTKIELVARLIRQQQAEIEHQAREIERLRARAAGVTHYLSGFPGLSGFLDNS